MKQSNQTKTITTTLLQNVSYEIACKLRHCYLMLYLLLSCTIKGFTQSKSMCLTLSFERSLSIPLKTSEKQRFSDVIMGDQKRTLVRNRLINPMHFIVIHYFTANSIYLT